MQVHKAQKESCGNQGLQEKVKGSQNFCAQGQLSGGILILMDLDKSKVSLPLRIFKCKNACAFNISLLFLEGILSWIGHTSGFHWLLENVCLTH